MKTNIKSISTIVLFLTSLMLTVPTASAQPPKKADTVKKSAAPAPAPVPYVANPNRVYTINLTESDLRLIFQTGPAGIIPYLKTTKLPMDQADAAEAYYKAIYTKISDQYTVQWKADREKFVADSIKASAKKTAQK